MNTVDLSGVWSLKRLSDGKVIDATLPGSDIGNFIKAGVIENPLINGDDSIGEKLGEDESEFSRSFTLSDEDLQYGNIHLRSGGFDTLCSVYINGELAFETNNAHISVDKDIKKFVRSGENGITLRFHSSVKYIKRRQKENPITKNNNGINGAAYIRKPSCHFGWDWGPCLPYNAVLGSIEIKCFNREISEIKISQSTKKESSEITVHARGADSIYILSPSSERIDGEDGKFTVKNPQLWYTRELSGKLSQPLYSVVFENDEETVTKKIGLRSLYLDRSKDKYGENFVFVLNGEKIFAKGANLIPFSAIYEDSDNSTVDYYLDLAEKSNFNIIRVWGGGSYAGDYFLEQCDKRGILVWQDFCFACLMYPFYENDFLDNVVNEARENVLRMTTHPCLALWCGNNEIEVMFGHLPRGTKLMKAYEEFFYRTLPSHISNLTDTDYIPTSPIGTAPFKDCAGDSSGDTHMWNVWHGLKKLDYYQTRYSRFLSEFGLESLPSMKAIKTFADEENLTITSPSFNRHQKCVGGNKKMLFYLAEMFDMPKSFEDMPYLTGIIQAECVKNATVHFRQNKGRCNGSVFWQFNDVWNCPSWSSVDFEGVPKALQYKAAEFFAPVAVTCKKENSTAYIFAHNDTLTPVEFPVKVYINNAFVKEYTVSLKPNSCCKLDEIKVNKTDYMQIKYLDSVITEIFAAPCDMKLKKADIKVKVQGNKMTLKSDSFAYNVCVEAESVADKNYFCLAPGEERTIEFNGDIGKYNIRCANNIEFKKSSLKKQLFRLFYRLEPLNIGNYVYYSSL